MPLEENAQGKAAPRGGRRVRPRTLPPAVQSARLLICLNPHDVGMFRFLLEAHDNLALFTVIDSRAATLKLLFSPHQETAVRAALTSMAEIVDFEVAPWPFAPLEPCTAVFMP